MATEMVRQGQRFAVALPVCRIGLPFGKATDGQETQEHGAATAGGVVAPSMHASACGSLDGGCDLVPSWRKALLYGATNGYQGSLAEDVNEPSSQTGTGWGNRAIRQADIATDCLVCAEA